MTPIDNAVLTEILDNALSDIKYLRAERNALREAKAKAKAEAYEAKAEADEAQDIIDELEKALKRAIARADENADKLTASVKQAQAWADKYNRSERQVEDLRAELQRHKEALHISIRETSDLEDHLALYQDNCECAL